MPQTPCFFKHISKCSPSVRAAWHVAPAPRAALRVPVTGHVGGWLAWRQWWLHRAEASGIGGIRHWNPRAKSLESVCGGDVLRAGIRSRRFAGLLAQCRGMNCLAGVPRSCAWRGIVLWAMEAGQKGVACRGGAHAVDAVVGALPGASATKRGRLPGIPLSCSVRESPCAGQSPRGLHCIMYSTFVVSRGFASGDSSG